MYNARLRNAGNVQGVLDKATHGQGAKALNADTPVRVDRPTQTNPDRTTHAEFCLTDKPANTIQGAGLLVISIRR